MFYIETESPDGVVIKHGRFWATAEQADTQAELTWLRNQDTERYARISVIEEATGETYSDWEF